MNKKWILFPALALFASLNTFSQDAPAEEEKKTEIKLDAEYRVRTEVKYGYRTPPNADSKAAFLTSQRSRLRFDFKSKWVDTRLALQDVRTWGEIDSREKKGTFMLYEAWAEIPVAKSGVFLRLGRQEVKYDNERLLATNNWRQAGRTHDAVTLKYKKKNSELEVVAAYNQKADNNYGRQYLISNEEYKLLNVIWFKQKWGDKFSLALLNIGDGYQADTTVVALKGSQKLFYRLNHLGRVEFDNKKSLYFTVAGAVQYGKTNRDQKILAWYVQPEVRYTGIKNLTVRAGAEIISGQDGEKPVDKINSFSTLYGVGHRFNGTLDLFTSFPGDVKGGGLINPYLFFIYKFNDKVNLGTDFHVFTHANNYVSNNETLKKFIGFETDILLRYNPNRIVGLEVGYSLYKGTETSVAIKGGEADRLGHWAYTQLTIRPEFFKHVK